MLGLLFVFAFCGWGANAPLAQQDTDDEQSRQLFAEEFLKARPAKAPARRTSRSGPSARANQTAGAGLMGVTFWRLRPAAEGESGARLLDHEEDTDLELVGERVSADTKFAEGQKVRLSIESPRTGYLYVIDREQYADGTTGDPYLIFPTLRTRGGENAVKGGRLIEIPDQSDRPFYFRMKRSRADQVGELLTVLVTPKPLPNLEIGRKPLKLDRDQVTQWEQKWKTPAKRVELAKQAGKVYTTAEKSAGANTANLLKPQDPPPQTIYRVAIKPGDAVLIAVSLQYESSTK
jgi:hypothetical protein